MEKSCETSERENHKSEYKKMIRMKNLKFMVISQDVTSFFPWLVRFPKRNGFEVQVESY